MSELTVTLLRLGFLALLWIFVLSAIAVLRRDLAPRRAPRGRQQSRVTSGPARPTAAGATPTASAPAAPVIAAPAPTAPPQPTPAADTARTDASSGEAAPATQTPARAVPKRRSFKRAANPTRIAVTGGPQSGVELELGDTTILIGRTASATLHVDDDYTSTRHARIYGQDGAWWVEDLGSTNGTFVNDERITEPTRLAAGSVVRLGKTILELRR